MNIISYISNNRSHLGMIVEENQFVDMTEHLNVSDSIDFINNFSEYKNRIYCWRKI